METGSAGQREEEKLKVDRRWSCALILIFLLAMKQKLNELEKICPGSLFSSFTSASSQPDQETGSFEGKQDGERSVFIWTSSFWSIRDYNRTYWSGSELSDTMTKASSFQKTPLIRKKVQLTHHLLVHVCVHLTVNIRQVKSYQMCPWNIFLIFIFFTFFNKKLQLLTAVLKASHPIQHSPRKS